MSNSQKFPAGADSVSKKEASECPYPHGFIIQTMAAVANCILALLNHPEVLKKAYEEVDRVIKPGHLPDFDDQELLPYITAIVKESARWKDTAPLCELIRLHDPTMY